MSDGEFQTNVRLHMIEVERAIINIRENLDDRDKMLDSIQHMMNSVAIITQLYQFHCGWQDGMKEARKIYRGKEQ